MKHYLLFFLTFAIFFVTTAPSAHMQEKNAAGNSATLAFGEVSTVKPDARVVALSAYLSRQNSPLADYADVFVKSADENKLDWKLVAAISGVESTFGANIPANSYNGWGWGVYDDHFTRFASWDEAIKTISKGLKENYIDHGAQNVYGIGRTYASSPAWADHVVFYMNKIQDFSDALPDNTLSLTL